MELAIDTSTRLAGVALAHEGRLLAEHTWQAGFNHTVELHPAIQRLLEERRLKPDALQAVVVATGPGTFSGLRVGLAAAKGLAMALGIPIVGVGTLMVEAYPFLGAGLPVGPLLDAGRGEVASALFREGEGWPVQALAPEITTVDRLCEATRESTLFCGEHLPAVRAAIAARLGPLARFPPDSALLRRPATLAELGWRRLSRGEADDLATLQPVYLRPPSITRPRAPTPVSR